MCRAQHAVQEIKKIAFNLTQVEKLDNKSNHKLIQGQ